MNHVDDHSSPHLYFCIARNEGSYQHVFGTILFTLSLALSQPVLASRSCPQQFDQDFRASRYVIHSSSASRDGQWTFLNACNQVMISSAETVSSVTDIVSDDTVLKLQLHSMFDFGNWSHMQSPNLAFPVAESATRLMGRWAMIIAVLEDRHPGSRVRCDVIMLVDCVQAPALLKNYQSLFMQAISHS